MASQATETSIRITLTLPPADLSPNARVHWRRKARAVKAYRDQAYLEAIQAGGRNARWADAVSEVAFYWPDGRQRDYDNASATLKPAWDGMVDAGLLVGDASKSLSHRPIKFGISGDHPRVEIRLFRQDTCRRFA